MYNYQQPMSNQAHLGNGLIPTSTQPLGRRYSLEQEEANFNPLNSNSYQPSFATNTICDKYDPTSSSINLTNERILPFVPNSAKQSSLTSSMVLNNQLNSQLDTLTHHQSNANLHQSQRLMPRLPFKSYSTDSKLIGNQNPNYLSVRTKPIVEPDDCYDANMETTLTSGRRLSGKL